MKQLTKEQAIKIAESKCYESWPLDLLARFQMYQTKLCMDFEKFHGAVELTLGRPVTTMEFASDRLHEAFRRLETPTVDELIRSTDPLTDEMTDLFESLR